MSNPFDALYKSMAWHDARAAVIKRAAGLCERCAARGFITPGREVHHIKPLTHDNWRDTSISLNQDNLILLCVKCHDEIHAEMKRKKRDENKRWEVDASGKIFSTSPFSEKNF